MERTNANLLYSDISYQIQGSCFEVKKTIGLGHKEQIYYRALIEQFEKRGLQFQHEPRIPIRSPETDKIFGHYQPDFLIENKVLIEIKSLFPLHNRFLNQIYDYLRNGPYELAYFINFGGARLFIKRFVYSNERKHPSVLNS